MKIDPNIDLKTTRLDGQLLDRCHKWHVESEMKSGKFLTRSVSDEELEYLVSDNKKVYQLLKHSVYGGWLELHSFQDNFGHFPAQVPDHLRFKGSLHETGSLFVAQIYMPEAPQVEKYLKLRLQKINNLSVHTYQDSHPKKETYAEACWKECRVISGWFD